MLKNENPAGLQGAETPGCKNQTQEKNNAPRHKNQVIYNAFSVYNGIDPKPIDKATWDAVIKQVKSPKHPQRLLVEKIRKTPEKAARNALKEKLLAYSFSGTFTYRKNANITITTGFIIADLDHVPDVGGLLKLLKNDPLIWFCFVSPSGDGIKVGIRAHGIKNDKDHKIFFAAIEPYFLEVYGIKIDPACKDISRLTFTSFDPNAFINKDAEYFDVAVWTPQTEPEKENPPPIYKEDDQSGGWQERYGRKVLENGCNKIRQSAPNNQHATRIRQARLIGGYIASRFINESEAITALENAVAASGAKDMKKAMQDVQDGIKYGKAEPLQPDEQHKTTTGPPAKPEPDKAARAAENILKNQEPCGPFDLGMMPDNIRLYVESICRSTDADSVLVLMAVLSAISARIGRRVYLPESEYFNKLFCNIWVLVLSLSGSFKTTALNKGCRIIYQKNSEIIKQIEAVKNDPAYQNDAEELKKRISEIEKNGCLLPNRMSAEGLLDHLSKGCGGLLPCSEFGEWLANLGKNHNAGLKPLFTDLFDCPNQYSYVTKSAGHLIIRWPFISIFGVSTLEWIRENVVLGDVGSGFFARKLMFYPPQKKLIPPALPVEREPVDIFTEKELSDRLDALPDELSMHLKPDARAYFEKIHAGIYAALDQLDERDQELLGPYAKRWSPYVLKIAMVLQAVQEPTEWMQESGGCLAGFVSVENIQAAASVVEYAIQSTVYLFQDQLGMSKFQNDCKNVVDYLAKNGGTVVRHKMLSSRTLTDGAKQYDEILETLAQQNKIEIIQNEHEVKKYEKYQLVA